MGGWLGEWTSGRVGGWESGWVAQMNIAPTHLPTYSYAHGGLIKLQVGLLMAMSMSRAKTSKPS